MQEQLRALVLKLSAAGAVIVSTVQGALDVHLPAITAVIENNPNGTLFAVAGYFLALHVARQNS